MEKQNLWVWPIVICLSAISAVLVTSLNVLPLARALITAWFLLFCPGMAFVRLLHLRDGISEWTLAVALSLALDAAVSLVMVYIHAWSPQAGLRALILISLAGAAIQAWRAFIAQREPGTAGPRQTLPSIGSRLKYRFLPASTGDSARALLVWLGFFTLCGGLAFAALIAFGFFINTMR